MKQVIKFKPTYMRLKDVIGDIGRQMQQAQLLLVASSLAYTTILSIIPLLAVSFAIFQAFGGLNKLSETVQPFILENLAEGAGEEVIQMLNRFIANAHANAIGLGGLIGLLFTSMSMLSSAEKAINKVWGAPMNRSLFQRISAYWFFITLGPLALAVAIGAATSSNLPMSNLLPSGTGIFVMTAAFFFMVYKWVPHCRVRWSYALISGVVTAVFWNIARIGYAFYTKKAISYNKIYGSLSAIPILLLWIYIAWVVVLAGAALTAALQKRYHQR